MRKRSSNYSLKNFFRVLGENAKLRKNGEKKTKSHKSREKAVNLVKIAGKPIKKGNLN